MEDRSDREARRSAAGRLDVAPWVAAAALLVAVVAVVFAVVAISKADDEPAGASTGMQMSGGHAAMGHMEPVSTEGITEPPSQRGGTRLDGVRRNGALEFKLDARPVWWRLYEERRVVAWAYNGIVPGPEIRVRNGERVRIRFTNRLPEETTVHWHGIGVPNSQDGVPDVTQDPIEAGESFTYEFTARPAGDPDGGGTFLYHSHVEEDRQMSVGLAGTFVIDPPGAERRFAEDRTMVISEWTADADSGRTRGVMEMEGMFPNFFTINGKSFPATETVKVRAGERVLFRIVNAGQFAHPMHLHGTAVRVVARDGHPVRGEGLRDTLLLGSGERADVAFTLPQGKWIFHCHIGHHLTNDSEGPGGLMAIVEAT
jgi:FtsP/CotA-like multicopper oxidase with cupredoxin domain